MPVNKVKAEQFTTGFILKNVGEYACYKHNNDLYIEVDLTTDSQLVFHSNDLEVKLDSK